jgi:hypothetical protein
MARPLPMKLCTHPRLGVVLVDPAAQLGLTSDMVRLFKVTSRTSATFKRDIVFRDLTPCADELPPADRAAVETYAVARQARRKPYCESCRRHIGSVDVSLCEDCDSLRCTCGACGCVATSRRRRAA